MTGPRERHPGYEELISASLHGDLTDEERRRLDDHLGACAACRSTLAAFGDQRRIMGGLRHVPPPRDLGARVRTGIERGRFASLPWWRRPATLVAGVGGSLAAVAGALLAIVLLNAAPSQVGDASPTPSVDPSASIEATPTFSFPVASTPTPAASIAPPSPSEPEPTPTPPSPSPEPDVYLALTGPHDNLALTIRHGPTGELIHEVDTPPGPPVAAELSPDGQWLAYVTPLGESGRHEVRATRLAEGLPSGNPERLPPIDSPIGVGETIILGESLSDTPFLEQLFWSAPRGGQLAYTLADPEGGDTDVWIFEPEIGEFYQLTDTGNAFAASWIPGDGEATLLWISLAAIAGEQPVSHVVAVEPSSRSGPITPADVAVDTAEGVFQPVLSPNGRLAIYWNGAMDRIGPEDASVSGWRFVSGAQPHLAEHIFESERYGFANERPIFSDLFVGREGFTSAAIAWGQDGDAYAVWDVQWTGLLQGPDDEPYPDASRVYFGHATDPRGLTRVHAIDRGDIPEGSSVVDVKVAPTGEHLVITALRPVGGVLEAPTADLLLIERNTGDQADEVVVIRHAGDGWFGPAAFDAIWETAARP